MRLEITKHFISKAECKMLNEWVYQGVENKWLDNGICTGKITDMRLTSRLYGNRFKYPPIVLDIANRIRRFAGISKYAIIDGHGRDGIVVSYTKAEGDIYKHKDPKQFLTNRSALRCNIMTQKTDDGGELFVNGEQVKIQEGDLHCYLASDFEHYVTKVKGSTPRILWMFGAYVPKNDWENGQIKYGLS